MKIPQKLEKQIARKFKEIDQIVKNSFSFIRQDVEEIQNSHELMKKYLRNKDKQDVYARKQDNKIRNEFRKNVDEFTEKITQLKIAFAKVKEVEENIVTKKDLAQIEEQIRITFKQDIDEFKEQTKEFKQHINDFNKRLHVLEKQAGVEPPVIKDKNKDKGKWFGWLKQ